MEIPINNLVYLNDQNLFRAIVSSANRFPGLYRKSSAWCGNSYEFVSWIKEGLIGAYLLFNLF
jgi:hypothetical protein